MPLVGEGLKAGPRGSLAGDHGEPGAGGNLWASGAHNLAEATPHAIAQYRAADSTGSNEAHAHLGFGQILQHTQDHEFAVERLALALESLELESAGQPRGFRKVEAWHRRQF